VRFKKESSALPLYSDGDKIDSQEGKVVDQLVPENEERTIVHIWREKRGLYLQSFSGQSSLSLALIGYQVPFPVYRALRVPHLTVIRITLDA